MRTVELFSGTASISKVLKERGHETVTIDKYDRFHPDITEDILYFDKNYLSLDFKVDILWASPPCQSFSIASVSHHWNKDLTPKSDRATTGYALLIKTLALIEELQPIIWFIENPVGMMRKMPVMGKLPRYTVTYCQYGDTRMKPTDIWTNLKWEPRPMCKNGDSCHESAPRGSKTGTQGLKDAKERGRIPRELCLEIVELCEKMVDGTH